MKNIIKIVFLFLPALGFSQTANPLSDLLWNSVQPCYTQFEDIDEDGTADFEKIDDAKNGFLKIWGSWPACGCACSSTAAAYKNKDGVYTILQSSDFSCSWEKRVSSNRDLKEILPADFGLNSFSSGIITDKLVYPAFFLNFTIPQYGTDTKVNVEMLPFGLKTVGKDLFCFEYKEDGNNVTSYFEIKNLVEQISTAKTLDYLLAGEFSKISQTDLKFFEEAALSKNGDLAKIQEKLKTLKSIYDVYSKLEFTELTLGWDKQNSRFYIKEKGKKAEKISFREFLIQYKFWSPIC